MSTPSSTLHNISFPSESPVARLRLSGLKATQSDRLAFTSTTSFVLVNPASQTSTFPPRRLAIDTNEPLGEYAASYALVPSKGSVARQGEREYKSQSAQRASCESGRCASSVHNASSGACLLGPGQQSCPLDPAVAELL